MFTASRSPRPSVYSDATPTTDQTQLMLQTLTGSGAMTGAGPVGASQVSADGGEMEIPWFLVLGGLAAAWFVLRRGR